MATRTECKGTPRFRDGVVVNDAAAPNFLRSVIAESLAGGVVAAHAMDTASGRSGGRAEIQVGRGGVVFAEGGAEEELEWGDGAAVDVAADEIGVARFKDSWACDVTGEDGGSESGGEALDLGLDAVKGSFFG
jgi:hypothetical protein